MDPCFVIDKQTLDVEEFLCDVSMHLRRRDMRILLRYIGSPEKEIEALLYGCRSRTGPERGMLTSSGIVIEGSSGLNFLEQRKRAMMAWWEYATNSRRAGLLAKQPPGATSPHKHIKVNGVESTTSCSLPLIPEAANSVAFEDVKASDASGNHLPPIPAPVNQLQTDVPQILSETQHSQILVSEQPGDDGENAAEEKNSHEIPLPIPIDLVDSARPPTGSHVTLNTMDTPQIQFAEIHPEGIGFATSGTMVDREQQTDVTGRDVTPDQVAIQGSSVTLEELLRKLWRGLMSCGMKRVVEELQQRWMIRVDLNQGRADMYPKMTWGTPSPPKTPFTYPPYKKIGHMAVMGSTICIEAKPTTVYAPTETGSRAVTTVESGRASSSKFMANFTRSLSTARLIQSRGGTAASVMLDGAPVTSFPARDSWKLRTDTVRRKGATICIRVSVDDVILPTQPSVTWGSSLNVSPHQIRERVARVFFNYVVHDSRNLCRTIDRVEKVRGLVIEAALKRIGGGGSGVEITSSELVLQCRCLQPETVEQIWLIYQSGQLRENIQAGLVTRPIQEACCVENVLLRVHIVEEEYRRSLGLLRRKPLPNTKSGRFYVTYGTAGAVGSSGNVANAQKQALLSVTRYMKLPAVSPHLYDQNAPPGPPTTSMALNNESQPKKTAIPKLLPQTGSLIHKVLSKELEQLEKRMATCEREWCDFAANHLAEMLRCARNVMQRRVIGATARHQQNPRCQSISTLRSLYKAVKTSKTKAASQALISPRVTTTITAQHHAAASSTVTGNHSNIALYPSDVAFSALDLVTTLDDDDNVVKARKREELDFVRLYVRFSDVLGSMQQCRATLQDKVVARLATNPTVAPAKHLYLAKEIYNLMERWRHLLVRDFNFAHDIAVQRLAQKILADRVVADTLDKEVQEQFPGIIALIPMMFHAAEQVIKRLKDLLHPKDIPAASSKLYSSLSTPRGEQGSLRQMQLRLSA